MAEFVQANLEELSQELQQLQKIKIFSAEETSIILRKRRNFEYKLQRQTKRKEDYLVYIRYENQLLELIVKRRKKIYNKMKYKEIEVNIIKRIHRLFGAACQRFQDDEKLWLSHASFARSHKEIRSVGKIYSRMLQVHGRRPELWVLAAKWEMEGVQSMSNARQLLQRGIRFNKSSQHLWQEYFRMELLNCEKLRRRRDILGSAGMSENEHSEKVLNGSIAVVVYERAIAEVSDDADFHLSFLPIVALFSFAKEIEEQIASDVMRLHTDAEMMYIAMAQRELDAPDKEDEAKYTAALAKVTQGLQCVFSPRMYSAALEFLGQCLRRSTAANVIQTWLMDRFIEIFERGKKRALLTAEMYELCADLYDAIDRADDALAVLQKGCEMFPVSVSLRLRILRSAVLLKKEDTVREMVNEALDALPDAESLPLWEFALHWICAHCAEHAELLFQRGILQPPPVARKVKEMYFEWAVNTKKIGPIRRLFSKLVAMPPYSEDLYFCYLQLELSQVDVAERRLRQSCEDAVREFGARAVRIWMLYLEFVRRQGDAEAAALVHSRALKSLDADLVSEFTRLCALSDSAMSDDDDSY